MYTDAYNTLYCTLLLNNNYHYKADRGTYMHYQLAEFTGLGSV